MTKFSRLRGRRSFRFSSTATASGRIFRGGLVTGVSGEYVSTLGFPEDYINGFSRNSAGDITFGSKRPDGLTTELDDLKMELMRRGVRMDVLESAVPWSEFKKDDRGLVTCVVQDYRNDEVLMVAWGK